MGSSRGFLLEKVGDEVIQKRQVDGIKSGSNFVLGGAKGKQVVALQMKLELAIRKIDSSTLFALVTFLSNLSCLE